MKNVLIMSLFLLAMVSAGFGQFWVPTDISFSQLNIACGSDTFLYSSRGIVTIVYTPEANDFYANIVSPCAAMDPHWIVRNLYIPSSSWISSQQSISVMFDFSMIGIFSGTPVGTMGYALYRSDTVILSSPLPGLGDYISESVDTFTDHAAGVDPSGTVPGLYDDEPYPEFPPADSVTTMEYRGCRVPNIDLDNTTHPANATYAGDKGACAPAAAANSLKWLDDVRSDINIPDNLRTVMEEISGLMGRTMPGSGVDIRNFLKGKLDYIRIHGLNINVKFQSFFLPQDSGDVRSTSGTTVARNQGAPGNPYPTWDWLKAEIEDSEDVEIHYYWRDSEGNLRGHAAVVTGYEQTASGRKSMKIKHDRRQGRADAAKVIQEDLGIYIDGEGRMRIRGKSAFIGGVVSESPGTPYVSVNEKMQTPEEFLISAYPNPFNSSCEIRFQGFEGLRVQRIEIFDLNGRCVSSLTLGPSPVERERDDLVSFSYSMGEGVPTESERMREYVWTPAPSISSGIYLVRTTIGGQEITKRIIYLK